MIKITATANGKATTFPNPDFQSLLWSSLSVFAVLWFSFQDGNQIIMGIPRWFTCDNSCPGDHSEEFNIRGPHPSPSNKPPPAWPRPGPDWPWLNLIGRWSEIIWISMWSRGGGGGVLLTSVLTWTRVKTSATQCLMLGEITWSLSYRSLYHRTSSSSVF